LAGASPILALDMYEHSYHIDYGAKAAAYVDAFMQNINWDSAARRLPLEKDFALILTTLGGLAP
jgi:superoxide dismutase